MCVWRTRIPLKIRVFIWQILNDKIQSAEQLKKRNWPGPIECKLCVSSFNVLLLNFAGVFVEMFFCWDYTPWIVDDLANLCTEKSNKQTQKFIFFWVYYLEPMAN